MPTFEEGDNSIAVTGALHPNDPIHDFVQPPLHSPVDTPKCRFTAKYCEMRMVCWPLDSFELGKVKEVCVGARKICDGFVNPSCPPTAVYNRFEFYCMSSKFIYYRTSSLIQIISTLALIIIAFCIIFIVFINE